MPVLKTRNDCDHHQETETMRVLHLAMVMSNIIADVAVDVVFAKKLKATKNDNDSFRLSQ